MIRSFDVISLSPFDINFQEGFDPSDTVQSNVKNVMLVEDKNHRVELDSEETHNKWQSFFVVKSVAPSCMLRL